MSEATGNKRGLSEAAPNQAPGGEAAGAVAKPAAKKARKKPVTAKSLGLTKDEYDRVKAAPIKKELKAIVKTLARQVDSDWHDGYEEQAETKGEWFEALEGPLQAVLDIGVGKRTALVQCNEILKIVADSYADLLACPCRCDTSDELYEMDKEFELDLPWGGALDAKSGNQEELWSYVWVALLRVHSAVEGVDESVLFRCMKDASDNMRGAEYNSSLPGVLYDPNDKNFDDRNPKDAKGVPKGTNLAQLVKDRASEWKTLPTTKKVHRMRRATTAGSTGRPSVALATITCAGVTTKISASLAEVGGWP